MSRLSCGAAGNKNVCRGYLEIEAIKVDPFMALQSRCLCCIPKSFGDNLWAQGDGGCWRNISETALLRCSILNKEPKRDLQVKLSPPLCTQRETGLQQLQGAAKGVGSSWWVTGEELLGSGWWELLWKILGVFQCLSMSGSCREPQSCSLSPAFPRC